MTPDSQVRVAPTTGGCARPRRACLEADGGEILPSVVSEENAYALRGVRYPVSLPSERASRRRSLDERFFVRFPAAYRLLADRLSRLPPWSRIRRSMLALRIRRV